jgi:hypothetical protein
LTIDGDSGSLYLGRLETVTTRDPKGTSRKSQADGCTEPRFRIIALVEVDVASGLGCVNPSPLED